MVRSTRKTAARKRKPAVRTKASRVLLMVATRKGLWLLHGDAARKTWRLDGPHFLGQVFNQDKRIRVVASCGGKEFPPALNEIYICRTNLTKTAEIEIKFQNDTVKQRMDGVIIATPSGSTGHSFSLGGRILHESLDVLIITPVAPVYRLESNCGTR